MEKKRHALRKLLEAVEKELLKKPNRKTLDRLSLAGRFQDWESFKETLQGDLGGETFYGGQTIVKKLKTKKKRQLIDHVSFFVLVVSCTGVDYSSQTATLLLDTSSLTGEVAQVVQLSATNLTNLVDLDALNVG